MNKQDFPPGWDEERVRDVLAHYEDQTEDEQFAEIEAAHEAVEVTPMAASSRQKPAKPPDNTPSTRPSIGR